MATATGGSSGSGSAGGGGGGGGSVNSVNAGTNVTVSGPATDPVVNATVPVASVAALTGAITAQALDSALVKEYYVTNAAAATSLTLSGLDGDTDGDYQVEIEFRSAAASNGLEIQLNGAATNLKCVTGNRLNGAVARTDWKIGRFGTSPFLYASGNVQYFQGWLRARSGRLRLISLVGFTDLGGANDCYYLDGAYSDTATNLTSISIIASQASGITAGSYIRLLRVQSSNPLA